MACWPETIKLIPRRRHSGAALRAVRGRALRVLVEGDITGTECKL